MSTFYAIAELIRAGKALLRGGSGGVTQVGTEAFTDHDLTLHAAARLLQGNQVAAAYMEAQLDPRTIDATGRDRLVSLLGISIAHPATPARGLIALLTDLSTPYTIPAGTVIVFPAEAFADGIERGYRTLEDVDCPGAFATASALLAPGSGLHKLRPRWSAGVTRYSARDLAQVKADNGSSTWLVVARSANPSDQSLDLLTPVLGALHDTEAETVEHYTTGVVVSAECITPGAAGNAPPARAATEDTGVSPAPIALLLEMGGGGDEVGEASADAARTIRLIEDTVACPPGFGNVQHWRELALACPDVALDDVVVYQHVRGLGTIDLVCIGPSGGVRAPSYPDTDLRHVPWGNNTRVVGDVQAARVEAWCRSQASYFDDVCAHSVRWDYRGATYAEAGYLRFLQGVCRVDMNITPALGYGPDAGVVLEVTPHTRHASKLYPASIAGTIPPAIAPGQRVWAAIGPSTASGQHAFATVVTEVLSVAHDRSYLTIQPVTDLLAPNHALAVPGTDALSLQVLRWGTAGPVTQPAIDAVFSYFDELGPGSYPIAPKGPGYVQRFWGSELAAPMDEPAIHRWPPEGRRWSSGLRASELRARLLEVEGIAHVRLGKLADDLLDCDPAPLTTLSLNGVLPRYA